MKKLPYIGLILLAAMLFNFAFLHKQGPAEPVYQFKAKTIEGQELDFSRFKGKKLLIVNTASKCGFTPQFEQLEAIYKQYKGQGLEIVGFPSNDFKHQDPGGNKEIQEFCQRNYGVTFTMMEKVHVKGDSIAPIYQWLTQKEKNGKMSSSVKWNFQKYLIDENGYLVDIVSPWKKPTSGRIMKWLGAKD